MLIVLPVHVLLEIGVLKLHLDKSHQGIQHFVYLVIVNTCRAVYEQKTKNKIYINNNNLIFYINL